MAQNATQKEITRRMAQEIVQVGDWTTVDLVINQLIAFYNATAQQQTNTMQAWINGKVTKLTAIKTALENQVPAVQLEITDLQNTVV